MKYIKKAIVLGGGGFIGHHLIKLLKNQGFWVRGVDLKFPEFCEQQADDFIQGDLRNLDFCERVFDQKFDEVYQLAADMGGAGFVFTGENDADIMHNSASINLNVLETCKRRNIKNILYSSSACIYPKENQLDPDNPICEEDSAYPANPDSDYGWEKLFSERIYAAYAKNYNLSIM
jgi:GDP-D-mannose 3',5'-epimerase